MILISSGPSLWYERTTATDALSPSSLTISLPYGTFFEEIEISSVEIVFYRNRRNLDLVNFLSTATDDLSPSVIFFDDALPYGMNGRRRQTLYSRRLLRFPSLWYLRTFFEEIEISSVEIVVCVVVATIRTGK